MPKKEYKQTKEHRKKLNGKNHPMYGKHHTQKAIEKIRTARIGKHHSKKTREKISIANSGTNNHFWQEGKSFELYSRKWTNKLRQSIRKRDNFTCQNCNTHQNKLKRKLDVHHIDYNKQNCNHNNLISLCNKCHRKTNYRRNYWTTYFQIKIQQIYNIV